MSKVQPLGANPGKFVCTGLPLHAAIPSVSQGYRHIEIDQKAIDMVETLFKDVAADAEERMTRPEILEFFRKKNAEHLKGFYMHADALVKALFKNFHNSTAYGSGASRQDLIMSERSIPLSLVMERQLCVCIDMAILAMAYFEKNPVEIAGKPATVKMLVGDTLDGPIRYLPRGFRPDFPHAVNIVQVEGQAESYILDPARPRIHDGVKYANLTSVDSDIMETALNGLKTPFGDNFGFFPTVDVFNLERQEIYGFVDNNGATYPLTGIVGNPKLNLQYDGHLPYFENDPYAPQNREK